MKETITLICDKSYRLVNQIKGEIVLNVMPSDAVVLEPLAHVPRNINVQ